MALEEEKGYVRATIAQEGAFDAGAYSFFGDMAPLDDGLGGALEEGLEAPPEEWPADGEGALEDDDDLPIEALMDEDEDEDLSLAALLRRQMIAQEGPATDEASSSAAASKGQQPQASTADQLPHSLDVNVNGLSSSNAQTEDEPLLPPMPPQPTMLGLMSHHARLWDPTAAPSLELQAQVTWARQVSHCQVSLAAWVRWALFRLSCHHMGRCCLHLGQYR
eukprot:gene7111-7325_t